MKKRHIKAGTMIAWMAVCTSFFYSGIETKADLVLEDIHNSFEPEEKQDEKKGGYTRIESKNGELTNILIELYRLQGQGYKAEGWLELNGDFYYKAGNEILTGFQKIGEYRYFFDENGKMETNCWKDVGENRYFFGETGEAYQAEAVEIEGVYYAFGADAAMQKNQIVEVENGVCYVGEDGAAVRDEFVDIGRETYYFDQNGRMTTGLIAVDGEEYYMGTDGTMQTGWQIVNGNRYLFHLQSGKMVKGVTIGDIRIDENGRCEIPDQFSIPMEELMQNPELPTGCESVALTIVLRHYGFELEKTTIADEYLEYSDTDFVSAYVGNPHTESGAGCFAPAITKAAETFLAAHGSDMTVTNLTGTELEDLYPYVANGTPVIVWNSMYLSDLEQTDQTYVYEGTAYYWFRREHCVVLCGYNTQTNTVTVNDPLEGIVERDADRFEEIYRQLGQMAVLIDPN